MSAEYKATENRIQHVTDRLTDRGDSMYENNKARKKGGMCGGTPNINMCVSLLNLIADHSIC